jgi:uncharacterized lipoprotein YddW (UPF0748 family)
MRAEKKRFCWLMLLLIGVVAVVWRLQHTVRAPRPPVRALWVTRFEYNTPEDVRRIIANVVDAGFTDVFFQIRGNGTAYYRSQLEPWAYELSGDQVSQLGRDPGWDPLQLALDEAAGSALQLHAYMNVMPGWKGLEDPPASAHQLWREHPDWFMVDMLGHKMLPTSGWYTFVNPVLPEVRAHLQSIVRELCRYKVAGIHLDYIRYPHDYHLMAGQRYPGASKEELMQHSEFSYDPVSLGEMEAKFGADITREEILAYRCDSITRVVEDISRVMQEERPNGCLLSASVWGNPVEGKHHAYQDSGAWIQQGLVDWAVQMNYGTKSFPSRLKAIQQAGGRSGFRRSVVVGINCKNEDGELLRQMDAVEQSGARGMALFAYSYLFDKQHQMTEKGKVILPRIRP